MDCEYSSLSQFHEDMRAMMETAQSNELMEVYHQAMKEVSLISHSSRHIQRPYVIHFILFFFLGVSMV